MPKTNKKEGSTKKEDADLKAHHTPRQGRRFNQKPRVPGSDPRTRGRRDRLAPANPSPRQGSKKEGCKWQTRGTEDWQLFPGSCACQQAGAPVVLARTISKRQLACSHGTDLQSGNLVSSGLKSPSSSPRQGCHWTVCAASCIRLGIPLRRTR